MLWTAYIAESAWAPPVVGVASAIWFLTKPENEHVKRQEYFALLVVVVLLVVPPYIPWQRLRLREGNKEQPAVPTSLAQKRERDHAHDDLTGMTLSNDLTVPASAATASVSIPIDRPYRVGQVTTTWGSKTIISNRSDGIDVAFDSPAPPTGGKLHYSLTVGDTSSQPQIFSPPAQSELSETRPEAPPVFLVSKGDRPIEWNSDLGFSQTGDEQGLVLLAIVFYGMNVGADPVQLRSAYVSSELTGEREALQVGLGNPNQLTPIQEINPIPPHAPIELWAVLKPSLHADEFLTKWGQVRLHVEYDGTKEDKIFDEKTITAELGRYPTAHLGPHITKKQ